MEVIKHYNRSNNNISCLSTFPTLKKNKTITFYSKITQQLKSISFPNVHDIRKCRKLDDSVMIFRRAWKTWEVLFPT